MNALTNLQPAHWLIAGVVLAALEIVIPGAILIWFGAAAIVVGLLLWALPDFAWQWQFILFAVLSISSIVAWMKWQKAHPTIESHPALNRRGNQLIGRVFTLDEAIVNGVGKVRVGDSNWKVTGPDLPAGTNVRVTAVDGTILVVEAG